jgi:hypothetical protein
MCHERSDAMTEPIKPDMSCYPYRRKGLYIALTVPLLVVLVLVFVYLWRFSPLLSLSMLLLYLATCYFQAYCCAYQDCPYIGGFCPAITGIVPASWMAKLLYGSKITKSERLFDLSAMIAAVAMFGMILLPVYWILKLGVWYVVGYAAFFVLYYLVFMLTVCPACAIRGTCPGGKLQGWVFGKEQNSI